MKENKTDRSKNTILEKIFGVLPDGKKITTYTLCNSNDIELCVINYGAIITSLRLPVNNKKTDVVLGFDTIEAYIKSSTSKIPTYFGAVIGRYSGRIKNGIFKLDEKQFQLPSNSGNNTLHGGNKGFDQVVWEVKTRQYDPEPSITFAYTSPAGEENFPGQLETELRYTLTGQNEVVLEYKAVTSEDTIINLTQHSYFNLDGHQGNVLEQELLINSTLVLEIDPENIPSGKIINAADKEFDFSKGGKCPATIDDTFVLEDNTIPAAILKSKNTGWQLTVFSDQPSLHVYVGGNCHGIAGKEATDYHAHSGICFESQNYPDAPNHNNFPNAVLRKGETYRQKTIWKFEQPK